MILTYVLLFMVVGVSKETLAQCVQGDRSQTSNCVVFDNLRLKTFDGKVFSYTSQCGYTLYKSNNVEVIQQDSTTIQIKNGLHIYQIKAIGSRMELSRDGNLQTIPHSSFGVAISKPGQKHIVTIKDAGVKVRYDGETIEIIVNNDGNNEVLGICGNNDGCSANDVLNDSCVALSVETNVCGGNARQKLQAENNCNTLFNNQNFAKCGAYVGLFMDACVSDYCNCKLAKRNDCLCQVFDAFARTCQTNISESVSWRSATLCPMECNNVEQEFMPCAPNKVQLSCGEEQPDSSSLDCEEGCYCPVGLRLFRDKCFIEEDCPCTYNDNIYNPGLSIAQDCNTCVCRKGKWDCTNKQCYVDGHCSGDPHYRTFDGKTFDFMGKCTYYVVRGNGFDVMCDHFVWKGAFVKDFQSTLPSYCAKVIIKVKEDQIELGQKHDVKVNSNKLDWFPFNSPAFYVTKPSNLLTTVTLRNSVIVEWNGASALTVRIPTTMKGRVKGLFGTYTKNQTDDFLMSNDAIATNPTTFGNSWKVPGSCENESLEPVPHPCIRNPAKKAKAEQSCALLKSGLFDSSIDFTDEYENCLYDACLCPDEQKDCICEFYAEQAAKSAANGVLVDWRPKVPGCEIKCPAGQTYQICANSCTRTCEDIAINPNCQKKCVEGCNCPEGLSLNSYGKCVPHNECNCVYIDARFAQDFTFIHEESKRICVNATWDVNDATDEDKTKHPSWDDLQKNCNPDLYESYTGCMRSNRLTCINKHLNQQPLYGKCEGGCECMNGFVYDTVYSQCVRPDECPCEYNGISYSENAERTDRNEKCTCKEGFWECAKVTDRWEKCSVWGNTHIRTFDELFYSFKGICEYTLLEDSEANGLFRVTLKTESCKVGSCIKQVTVLYKGLNTKEEKVIFTNGGEFAVIGELSDLVITESDLSVSVNVINLGVRVIWDKTGWAHIHVSQQWKSRKNHGGLCGKYDDNSANDLLTPNNQLGITHLVDYYRIDKSCSECTEYKEVEIISPEKTCDILYSEAFKTCGILKPFKAYYERCLIDTNLQLSLPESERFNHYCQTLSAYAQECNDLNLTVNWRTENTCPIVSKTCAYEGKIYNPGTSIAQDCNTCSCQKGKWDCTQKTCYVDGKCSGDPHCKTFDGKTFDFMGKCTYYLVRGAGFDIMCDHYVVSKGIFVKDFKSTLPSYCAKVIIKENEETIELGQKHQVKINGNQLDWFPFNAPSGFYVTKPSNLLTTVTLKNSVIVEWNGASTVTVRIPTTMKGQVKGLLGTYTKTKDDDFLMSNEVIAKTATAFGNSWKVLGSCENESLEPVPHPCLSNPAKKVTAEKACALLKSGLFDGSIDATEEYENCLYDACLCPDEQKDCICEFYAAQSDKCAANGLFVDWRPKVPGCEMKCPAGQIYQICGNNCGSSCEDIASNKRCERRCVEGCYCPEGQTLDNFGKCVPINQCKCVFMGIPYAPDFTFIYKDAKWTCQNGNWNTTPVIPDDKPIPPWEDLQKKCDANLFQEYCGCTRTNTLTCQNKHLNEQPLYGKCEGGCQCMNGFVYDTENKKCVKPENCPCNYNGVSYLENTVRTNRNEKCTCKRGNWECTENTDRWEKCSVWSNTHIRTFDELIYSFSGICEYVLLEDVNTNELFRVTLKTEKCNVGSCIKQVSVLYKGVDNKEEKVIFTNGENFVVVGQLSNLAITQTDLSVTVNVVTLGVKVIWDNDGWAHIHVSQQWKSRKNHGGLCGKYDDNPANDLLTPNNQFGITHLVDYYTVDKSCSECTEHNEVDIIPPENTCDVLFSKIFKTCGNLKPFQEYYKKCLIDVHLQHLLPENQRFNHFCQTLSAYAQECNDLNLTINWRTNDICPINPNPTCTYNGKVYKPGSSINQDCNTCSCQKGKWACTQKICYVDGKCSADPHCKTFDGKTFDFMGKCAYYLVRGDGFDVMCDHYVLSKGIFVKDFKSTLPSYCAKVTIRENNNMIELGQKHEVKVNGNKLNWFPFNAPSGFYVNKPSNLLTTVTLKNSVIIEWNGVSTITVRIPTTMEGQVKGLLGTYTKTKDDDFLMSNEEIAKTATAFGNSWKVPGSCENESLEPVPHPCLSNPAKKAKAEQACALLKSGLFDGSIDSAEEYENCLYDACLCPDDQTDCICELYAAQNEKCAANGFIVDWRSKVPGCAVKCPPGQIYQICGNHCGRSCEAISSTRICPKNCVEGCYCPVGQAFDDFGNCVPINQCKCVFMGKPYAPGFTFIYKNSKWTCQNGNWNTTPVTPDDKPIPPWEDLQKKCDANLFQEYCGCTRKNILTCQNKHLNEQPLYGNCEGGCECMNGFVYDIENKRCVKPENCPCNYNGISYLENAVRIERNEKCTCKGGNWECAKTTDRWEKCSVWSNTHIRTFDELIYSFSGICEYVLLEDINTNELFRVTLKTEKCNLGSCIKQISVVYKGVNNQEEKVIFTNGEKFVVSGVLSNFAITESDSSVLVNVVNLGVKVIWDKAGWAHIHISQQWKSRQNHGGLCGKYDDNPANDLLTPNNQLGITHLVDYYRLDKSCSECIQHEEVDIIPPENTCDVLYNQIFTTCGNLKPFKEYYKRCLIDANLQVLLPESQRFNHFCQTLSAYAQECNDLDMTVNWRTDDICPLKCKNPDQIYLPCAPNKRQQTCGDAETSNLSCKPGCYCPPGSHLSGGKCVIEDNCPCTYEGKTYNPGSSITQDCNTCSCRKGEWTCTQKTCYVDGKCSGDPHCKTFDGKMFDFMGKCTYYLVRGAGFDIMCDHYVVSKGTFVKDFKSTLPSYCAKVIIKENGEMIELGQKHEVRVNGNKLDYFPFNTPSGFYVAKPSNLLTRVTLKNSVIVEWNGASTVTVKIPTTMKGQVKGLLGTYTKNKDDDFLMSNEEIAKTATAFGNSWKVPGSCENESLEPVPHPCLSNPAKKTKAEEACALLKSGLFEGSIDSTEEYENCLYDACLCPDDQKDCVCEFYAAQSEKCAANGFFVDWRPKVPGCEIKCPAGQTYQNCGNHCGRSCEAIANTRVCPAICIEGCYCPAGQTLDDFGKCVPINKCNCVFMGKPYAPDFTFIYNDAKWICYNGNWNTTTVTPDDKPIPPWEDLQKKCDANLFQEYSGCMRTNTLTCQNKHLNKQPLYEKCGGGCQCMNGFVYDTENNKCVKPENCPCNYNGVSYLENALRTDRNEQCTCKGGNWECTENTGPWEKCTVWSNTHIRTFDELIYSFSGICEYVLLEDINTNELFRVTLKTEKCNVGSCIKQVSVLYKGVDNKEERIIFTTGEKFVIIGELTHLAIRDMDLSVFVNVVDLGVKVVWNKAGWAHIHVSQLWKSRQNHGGLCGKYDDNSANDLLTPNHQFGITHLVDYYRLDKSCSESNEHKEVDIIPPEKTCDVLYHQTFKTCGVLKSIKEYYQRCLIDANLQLLLPESQRFNYYCQTLAAYAQECNDLNVPVNWRTDDICPQTCESKKYYYPCQTSCQKRTCKNTKEILECNDKLCSETCSVQTCPANMIYRDEKYEQCVKQEDCDASDVACTQSVDVYLDCEENRCASTKLILNIHTKKAKK